MTRGALDELNSSHLICPVEGKLARWYCDQHVILWYSTCYKHGKVENLYTRRGQRSFNFKNNRKKKSICNVSWCGLYYWVQPRVINIWIFIRYKMEIPSDTQTCNGGMNSQFKSRVHFKSNMKCVPFGWLLIAPSRSIICWIKHNVSILTCILNTDITKRIESRKLEANSRPTPIRTSGVTYSMSLN